MKYYHILVPVILCAWYVPGTYVPTLSKGWIRTANIPGTGAPGRSYLVGNNGGGCVIYVQQYDSSTSANLRLLRSAPPHYSICSPPCFSRTGFAPPPLEQIKTSITLRTQLPPAPPPTPAPSPTTALYCRHHNVFTPVYLVQDSCVS